MLKTKEEVIKEFECLTDLKVDAHVNFVETQTMEACVYIKIFENGKRYIGKTVNFKRRMVSHKSNAKKCVEYALYRAMNKHRHVTYILWQGRAQKMSDMEKFFIQCYDSFGVGGYNMTEGGDGFACGVEHPFSKDFKYFETNPSTPKGFKTACSRQGWVFRHFRYESAPKNKQGRSRYFWYYIGEDNEDYFVFNNEVEYVYKNKRTRGNFEYWLQSKVWSFEDFEEIDTHTLSTNGHRLFVYKYVGFGKGCKARDYVEKPTKDVREDHRYYEYRATYRSSFKRWCKTHKYDPQDYDEIEIEVTKHRQRKYKYVFIGNSEGNFKFK